MLAELLVCPLCHAALDNATCTGCGHLYSVTDGALNLLPIPPPDPRVKARWGLREQRHAYEHRKPR